MRKLASGLALAIALTALSIGSASAQGFGDFVTRGGPPITTKQQGHALCQNGGYKKLGFENQGQCIKAVNDFFKDKP
jgi:hypothetical protein